MLLQSKNMSMKRSYVAEKVKKFHKNINIILVKRKK